MRVSRGHALSTIAAVLVAWLLIGNGVARDPDSGELARAQSLERQAEVLAAAGRDADAVLIVRQAAEAFEAALGPDHPELALTLIEFARLCERLKADKEAEDLYRHALAIREAASGPQSPALLESLEPLGRLYQMRFAPEAPSTLERILALRETAFGPDDPGLADGLVDLAESSFLSGASSEGAQRLERAVTIHEKSPDPIRSEAANRLIRVAWIYQAWRPLAETERMYSRILGLREKAVAADSPELVGALNILASIYKKQGRYAESESLVKRVLLIEEMAGAESMSFATEILGLASLYLEQDRFAEAEPLYQRFLGIAEKALQPDDLDFAFALANVATLYLGQGRYPEAEQLARRALDIAEAKENRPFQWPPGWKANSISIQTPPNTDLAELRSLLAEVYDRQGRAGEAELLMKRALLTREATPEDRLALAQSLQRLGLHYLQQERLSDAARLLERASVIFELVLEPDHPDLGASLMRLASLRQAQGRTDEAMAAGARSIHILEGHLAKSAGVQSAGSASERRGLREFFLRYLTLTQAAATDAKAAADTVSATFRVAQLAQASSAADAVAGMAVRFAAGSDRLAGTVRERQDLATRWQKLDEAIIGALGRESEAGSATKIADLRVALKAAVQQLQQFDAAIDAEFPVYTELMRPAPVALEAVQALLAPDEAMIVYASAKEATWLWALRRDRATMHKIDVGAKALAGEVTALRGRLDPDRNPKLEPFEATRAYELHQKILAPATPLLDGARQVFVVPDGALESLPMGVLVTQRPTGDPDTNADHRNVAWFARDHAITVLPSVGSLKALRQFTATARASSPFVGIGNPTLEGTPGAARGVKMANLFRGAVADAGEVRKLDPLPETADELRAVAKSLGAGEGDLYLGDRATEPTLRGIGLDRYRVVEFATHGLMSGNLRGLAEPALVLTPPAVGTLDNDGLLTASEVATLKLNADWVVLSACNTAAGDGTPDAGGLSGLAKAFFYAGARSLLVSHWSVPSQATVKLITGAFDALKADPSIGRAEALRRAEMGMMDPANPPEFSHPLAWAPFVLAGEGGAGR